jgi:hypothetical protein
MNSNTNVNGVKEHRWNDVGEKCLDCGDSDWMDDPICRPKMADPDTTATPDISVDPSSIASNSVPVDVLEVLDIEIDAIVLQVKRGQAPQHALCNMVAVRVAVAEMMESFTRLRAELAAKSKDAARWDWIMNNYYGGDLTRTQKVIGSCFSREAMEAAIDNDLGEGNGR